MSSSPLDAKLSSALGDRSANALKKAFGMLTIGDLLTHYPRRYARRGELTALSELRVDEAVTIVAEVIDVTERPMRQRKGSILEVRITDGQGILTLTFFNQAWRANDLKKGVRGIFAGKVGEYRGARQLAHPDYELFEAGDERDTGPEATKWAMQPIPIYPATSTVASWQIAKAVGVVLDTLPVLDDPVPASVRAELLAELRGSDERGDAGGPAPELLDLSTAYQYIHRPENDGQWRRARDTLRFHEAFVLQAALLQQRAALREQPATPRLPGAELAGFDAELPFTLTDDQRLVGDEIARDLASEAPMNRLVQGEVGSGKTLVAVRAMLTVAESGGQSALLAPTEVLAAQHLRSIVQTLGPDRAARLRPVLLTGQLPQPERRAALLSIASGASRIVVGTHALLGDKVQFADLGLVVVDEQHRFGVEQRESLRRKGAVPPHVLVLTATPIPRTVAMTVFGDLDVSTIATLPAGRTPIVSHVVPLADKPGWWNRVWERMGEELAQGRQGFVVVPAIDPATREDDPDALVDDPADGSADDAGVGVDAIARPPATVAELTPLLRQHPALVGRRIEPLHGRMSSDEKDAVMRAFARGEIDLLVSTTVIEVGVDVPNASTMVVVDADRFGVSQLHQLRGRVGRGGVPGLCLFVTAALPETLARERVEAVAGTLDGFALAQIDLELRREGDVLGATQSGGRSSLKLLRVATDGDLISVARAAAAGVLEGDAALSGHPALQAAIERRLDDASRDFLAKN